MADKVMDNKVGAIASRTRNVSVTREATRAQALTSLHLASAS